MQTKELLKKLEGINTIESVMSTLNVTKEKAIYYIYRLNKEGYVKKQRTPSKKRVYFISVENKQSGTSYYEILNKYSPIKLSITQTYKIYGREVTLEETLVFAVKTKKIRNILAALALFKKISNWKLLYELSKTNKIERKIGALYDLSRFLLRTKRMDGRYYRIMLPKPSNEYEYIIEGLQTKEEKFMKIEKRWKVYLPFNNSDVVDYL